ncbi:MAG: rhomboid family intramembrane serine protease [Myxococcaceae bacterium]|nr:rhomboid family intramembrane serine protease [Myxococcaceae bacterium]MCI0672706.1 rhomboid family intramembrane serine protease [Myxococcaceae bacterium]
MSDHEPTGHGGPAGATTPEHYPREVRTALPPLFCTLVIGCSAVVFLLNEFTGLLQSVTRLPDGRPVLIGLLDLYGPDVVAGQWWRVLTTAVDHHDLLHLVLNMSVVWTLGTGLERQMGTARFAVVSLITALGSATLVLLLDFDRPTVGASGMILGWAGVLLPLATREARRSLITWLVQIAIISFLPFVSWSGHLGGFLAGLVCGFVLKRGPRSFHLTAPLLVLAAAAAVFIATRVASGR